MGEIWVSLTRQGWDLHFCVAWAGRGRVRMTVRAGPVHTGTDPGDPPYPYPKSFKSQGARAKM